MMMNSDAVAVCFFFCLFVVCFVVVPHLSTRTHVNVLHTAQNGGRQLGAERIPHAVLDLLSVCLHRDALLTVHALARDKVACHQHVLLATARNVNS